MLDPTKWTKAQAREHYIRADAVFCQRHFYEFIRRAYAVAFSEKFIDGWHVAACAYAIQALWSGNLRTLEDKPADTLVINMPPGVGKSRLTCVLAAAWIWASSPEAGLWFTSFGQGLCDRDALDTRQLISSDWYRERFWGEVHLMDDANQKRRYNTNKGGWRLSASIESRVGFGEHPAMLVCVPYDGRVMTDGGEIEIGRIVEQNLPVKVASFDHESGSIEYDDVLKFEENDGKELVEIELDDGTILEVTEDHPVFIEGQGYVEACRIQPGQRVLTMGPAMETKTVKAVRRTGRVPSKVYNLKIKKNRNYFVNGVLVHNCDDPHDPEQGLSSTLRQGAIDTWTNKFSTRGIVKGVRKLIIAQRLHEEDLSGYVLANEEGVAHLCLPMEFEPERRCTVRMTYADIDDRDESGLPRIKREWTDPRTEPGELLWLVGMDAGKVQKLKKRLRRAHAIAGQLQQRPSAPEGDMFRDEWLHFVDAAPASGRAVRGWDKASTTKRKSDFTAGALWVDDGVDFYLVDIRRGKWEMKERDRKILDVSESDAQRYADYTVAIEREGGAGGKDAAEIAAEQIYKEGFRVRIAKAGNTKKEVRWEAFADALANGQVKIVRGPWTNAFTEELLAAPNGAHDDMVDAVAIAFNVLAVGRHRGRIRRDLLGLTTEEQQQLANEDAAAGRQLCESCVGLGCTACGGTGFVAAGQQDDLKSIFDAARAGREVGELGVRW